MSSESSAKPQIQPPTIPHPRRAPNWKPLLFWSSAVSALLLALTLSLHPHRFLRLLSPSPPPTPPRPPCVRWFAPFLSGGGYSSEAWSYITALDKSINNKQNQKNPILRLRIEQHGDMESAEFWDGLPEDDKLLAYKLHDTVCRSSETIVICHSEPGAWYPPLFETLPCPPTGYRAARFVIGRTMFETDRVSPEHVRRCNRMDAVWVPTEFHVSTFVRSGVDPSKVVKVVQPVDVEFFDPSKHEAAVIDTIAPVLGSREFSSGKEFVFLSVFKWEYRKGWDVLLKAYLQEFTGSDGVALYLLISTYHSDGDFARKIAGFVGECGMVEPANGWAAVHVIDVHVPQIALPGVYKAANAFVLPSRGEGWGRPIVEAMAMGLPVIATNWSGPTEYLTEENGYPLPVDNMSEVTEGPFKGHLWAEPSIYQLRHLMRYVVNNREESRERGSRAREDMIKRFSPEVVAGLVIDQIMKIAKNSTDMSGN